MTSKSSVNHQKGSNKRVAKDQNEDRGCDSLLGIKIMVPLMLCSQSGPNFSGPKILPLMGRNRNKNFNVPAPSFPAHNPSLWFDGGNKKISIRHEIG